MTRKDANNWYRRLCRCVKNKKPCVKFKTMPDSYGMIEWGDPDIILIDPRRRSPFIRTLIHEIIHAVDYDLTGKEVLRIESELFDALSDRQLNGLFKRVCEP